MCSTSTGAAAGFQRILGIGLAVAGLLLGGKPHAFAQTLPPATVPPASMFCDYEGTTTCAQGGPSILQCASSASATNVTTARTDSYALALTTQPGDTNIAGSGGWVRCDEAFFLQSTEGTDEWWWSSFYLPSTWHYPVAADGGCQGIGPEFHSNYSGDTQPNFEIQLCPLSFYGVGWYVRVYGGAGAPQSDGPGRTNFTGVKDPYGDPIATRGVWYDVLMHFHWSYTSAGVTDLWINGVHQAGFPYNGPNLYQGYSAYLKLPNYHPAYANTIYYDRTVRGPTQASVVPTATSTTTVTGSTTGTTTGTTSGTTTGTPSTSAYLSAYTGTPLTGTPITLPGASMAANFDRGGQNISYYDTTQGNLGGQYRTSEDVDIISSCDPNAVSPYVVTNFATGEWMNYTVNLATSGSYVFQLLASNNYPNATPAFHIEVDGVPATGQVPMPNTGTWCTFKWVAAPSVTLSAGKHIVKIYADRQYFNLEAVGATAVAAQTSTYMSAYKGKPYTGAPIAVPGTFMAANFDLGGQNIAYYTPAPSNIGGQYRTGEAVSIVASCDPTPTASYVVNNYYTGNWLNYTINVPTSGNYIVQLRASNNYTANVAFHVAVDGVKVAGPVTIPITGNWCSFQPVSTPAFQMSAGTHVLSLYSDQQYSNLETISILPSP
jgi:hypothetical protein